MRRLWPDSLAGWGILIVIAALTVAEITTLVAIAGAPTASNRLKGLFQLAERVTSVTRVVSNEAVPNRQSLAAQLGDATLAIRLDAQPLASETGDETFSELERVLLGRLTRVGVSEVIVARGPADVVRAAGTATLPNADGGPFERAFVDILGQHAVGDAYVVSTRLADGTWVNFVDTIAAPSSPWSLETLALMLAGILIVLLAATWALRQLTGPYGLLARAAERFGRDLEAEPLAEDGPREVRAAVHAFNLMRDRLRRMVEDRDQLAAAVSHDLRTPVTRLRLRAEFIEDPVQRRRMLADLDEIETMTQAVLAFASGSARPEPRQLLDLVSLIEALCDDAPDVTLELPPGLPQRIACWAQPVALRRCVANLIDNAVKYGRHAWVSLRVIDGVARVTVDDEGPGASEADFERMFRPFVRLETSRNRETGGTGLGLTIARSVARNHGGDVALSNRAAGGLHAEITLPLTAAPVLGERGTSPAAALRERAIASADRS